MTVGRDPPRSGPPQRLGRDDSRRLPALRGVVARQAHVTRITTAGGLDANNGIELYGETLTRFDEAGTPTEYSARTRRADGLEVQSQYYSATEVTFRDVANRHSTPAGLASCRSSAQPDASFLLFFLPTLTTADELRAAGYNPVRAPVLRAPALEPLGLRPRATLDNPRVAEWVKEWRQDEGRASETVVVNAEDGRIVASTYLSRDARGVVLEDSTTRHGPIEVYDSAAFPSLRPAVLDAPCE